MLSDEAIKEFQETFKAVYGKDLSIEEASELGTRLINFYKVVLNKNEEM